jgi:hypothetical protein
MKTQTIRNMMATALCGLILGAPAVYAKKGEKEGAGVRAGILTCEISGGTGFVFGSSKSLRCHYEGENGKAERYTGNINKFGIDVGVTGPATMTWAVIAPTSKVGKGALAGTYVGASAEATAGVGGGAHLLVGGSNKTISLQPLSVQGQTGVNAALAVSELVLDRA